MSYQSPPSLSRWMDAVLHDNATTQDTLFLNYHYETVPIFIFGPEKHAFSEEYVMKRYKCLGLAWTLSGQHVMRVTPDHEPLVFYKPLDPDAKPVYGELYQIPVEQLVEMDRRYSNGDIHTRRIVTVRFMPRSEKDQKKKEFFIADTWIYLANWDYWANAHPRTLRLGTVYTPNQVGQKPYYAFSAKEDLPNKERRVCL